MKPLVYIILLLWFIPFQRLNDIKILYVFIANIRVRLRSNCYEKYDVQKLRILLEFFSSGIIHIIIYDTLRYRTVLVLYHTVQNIRIFCCLIVRYNCTVPGIVFSTFLHTYVDIYHATGFIFCRHLFFVDKQTNEIFSNCIFLFYNWKYLKIHTVTCTRNK